MNYKCCREAENQIVLTEEEFGDELWFRLSDLLNILLEAGYECAVRYEETGIISVEFDSDRLKAYGNPTIAWIDDEEVFAIDDARESQK